MSECKCDITGFLWACENQHSELIWRLCSILDYDYITNVRDKNGNNAFILTCINDDSRTAEDLMNKFGLKRMDVQNNCGMTGIMYLCKLGHTHFMEFMIDNGMYNKHTMDVQDNDKNTAFMLACKNGHKDIVQLLVEILDKDSMNMKNKDGKNGLMLACENGYKEIVEILSKTLDKDSVDMKDKDEKTGLIHACENHK